MSTSTNGTATIEPTTEYEAAQKAEYTENTRKAIDASTWRRFASGAMVLLALSLVANAFLAHTYHVEVRVVQRTPHGLLFLGDNTFTDADIATQLGQWVEAVRSVPGDDLAIDQNVRRWEAMTADYDGEHARSDLMTDASHNNPKIERKTFTRTIDGFDALQQPKTNTWNLSWFEYTTKRSDGVAVPSFHRGVVTILGDANGKPILRLPTELDESGVTVIHDELH